MLFWSADGLLRLGSGNCHTAEIGVEKTDTDTDTDTFFFMFVLRLCSKRFCYCFFCVSRPSKNVKICKIHCRIGQNRCFVKIVFCRFRVPKCHSNVVRMPSKWHPNVLQHVFPRMLPKCYQSVTKVLPKCYQSVTKVLPKCYQMS